MACDSFGVQIRKIQRFYKEINGKRVTRERIGLLKDQRGYLYLELQEMSEVVSALFLMWSYEILDS